MYNKDKEKVNRYGIRKGKNGVGSVLIATLLFSSLIGPVSSFAAEVNGDDPNTVVEKVNEDNETPDEDAGNQEDEITGEGTEDIIEEPRQEDEEGIDIPESGEPEVSDSESEEPEAVEDETEAGVLPPLDSEEFINMYYKDREALIIEYINALPNLTEEQKNILTVSVVRYATPEWHAEIVRTADYVNEHGEYPETDEPEPVPPIYEDIEDPEPTEGTVPTDDLTEEEFISLEFGYRDVRRYEHGVEYIEDETLEPGEVVLVTEGRTGVVVYEYYYGLDQYGDVQYDGPLYEKITIDNLPIRAVYRVGVGETEGEVFIDERTTTSDIEYEEHIYRDYTKPVTYERVVQVGQNGLLQTTEVQIYVDGEPVGEPFSFEQILVHKQDHVIEQGFYQVDIPASTYPEMDERRSQKSYSLELVWRVEPEYIYDENLPLGTVEIEQENEHGLRELVVYFAYDDQDNILGEFTEYTVLEESTPGIYRIGIGDRTEDVEIRYNTIYANIPHDTEYIEDDTLPVGTEVVETIGEDWYVESIYLMVVDPLTGELITSHLDTLNVLTPQTVEVIRVGTMEETDITTEEVTVEEVIEYETEYVENINLPEGVERTVTEGENGLAERTYLVTYEDGEEVSRELLSEDVVTEPVNEVIEQGTGIVEEDVTTEEVEVPFDTFYEVNAELAPGETRVAREGTTGLQVITTTQQTLNGEPYGEPVVETEDVRYPIARIIEIAEDVEFVEEEETVEEVIEYETEYVENSELADGETNVITPGINGKIIREYLVTYVEGEEVSRELISETEVPAQNEVIEVGTGVLDEVVTTRTEEIEFDVEYVENPELAPGETKVVVVGENGEKTITTTQQTLNGEPVGEPVVTEEVTKEAVTQIVEIGPEDDEETTEEETTEEETTEEETTEEETTDEETTEEETTGEETTEEDPEVPGNDNGDGQTPGGEQAPVTESAAEGQLVESGDFGLTGFGLSALLSGLGVTAFKRRKKK